MVRRRSGGGGGLGVWIAALLILVLGGGGAGYFYLNEKVLKPKAEEEASKKYARQKGVQAKRLFFKGEYDAAFRTAQEAIDAQIDQAQGYFWAARTHLRIYQEGHHYPSPWNVGGVIRFTTPIPDDASVTEHREKLGKQFKLVKEKDTSVTGPWVVTVADAALALLDQRWSKAESSFAEAVKSPDADAELQVYLAISRIMQKKFDEAASGLRPHLGDIPFIDAKVVWAKAMQGRGLVRHLAGEDPSEIYEDALKVLQGVSSPRAGAARAEILTGWGNFLSDRGFAKKDVTAKYEEAAKQGEPLSVAMAKVAHAQWLIDHGEPLAAEQMIIEATRKLDEAVEKDVVNLNLLVRREVAMLTYARYLLERGEKQRAVDTVNPVVTEVDKAMEHRDTTANDRLALAIYRAWLSFTIAASRDERQKAAISVDALSSKHPSDPWPAVEGANLFRLTGEATAAEAGDPSDDFASAINLSGKAIERKKDFLQALLIRAGTYVGLALFSEKKGEDPDSTVTLAEGDISAIIELNDKIAQVYRLRGLGQMARASYLTSRQQDPAAKIDAAIQDFNKALTINPKWAEAYLDQARASYTKGIFMEARGEDPARAFDEADASLGRAIDIKASYAEALGLRAEVRIKRGIRARRLGKGGDSMFKSAVKDVKQALRFKSDFVDGFRIRGTAQVLIGETQMSRGEDPSDSFSRALEDLNRATEIGSHDALAHTAKGKAHLLQGIYLQSQGQDPTGDYSAALDALNQAIDLNASVHEAYLARGRVRVFGAEYQRRGGNNPTSDLNDAVSDFDRVLGDRPGSAEALIGRARARREIGVTARVMGGDAASSFRQAVEDAGAALSADESRNDARGLRAAAQADLAEALLASGQNPGEPLKAAARDADEALKIDKNLEEAALAHARAFRVAGVYNLLKGSRDTSSFDTAIKTARFAIKVNPNSAAARRELAQTYLDWAWIRESREDSGVKQYSEGLKAAEEGLKIDGADPSLARMKAWAHGLDANHDRRIGTVPTQKYEAALAAAEAAVQMNPNDARALIRRAETLLGWVIWHRMQNEMDAAKEKHARGLRDLQKAIGMNSDDALGLVVRSRYYLKIGQGELSRQDADKAVSICKWVAPLLKR